MIAHTFRRSPAVAIAFLGFLGLAANAQTPVATVSPSALTFVARDLNVTSASQTVTLRNGGTAALTITSVTASGDFAIASNACGASLAAGANCAITVTSTPTAVGVRAGALSIADNASSSTQVVALTGRGVDPAAVDSYQLVTAAGPGLVPGQSYAATAVSLVSPSAVTADVAGNLYVVNGFGFPDAVLKVTPGGTLTFYAGNGTKGSSGDGGPAAQAELNLGPIVSSVALDAAGDLFIPDSSNCRVREVNASTGTIATVAGNGTCGYSGDGGAASSAELNDPQAVAVDAAGDLFIADTGNYSVREVVAGTGAIKTVAGTGVKGSLSGANPLVRGVATTVALGNPGGLAVAVNGDLYIADTFNYVVWRVAAQTGQIALFAGQVPGSAVCAAASDGVGDGCPATSALFGLPNVVRGLGLDAAGNLYIAAATSVHEVLASSGVMENIAGQVGTVENDKLASAIGDGGPATAALFTRASGVFPLANGDVLIADGGQNRVRRVSGGVITTIVGNGFSGDTGDGGAPTSAQIIPVRLAVEDNGGLLISDQYDNLIREVKGGVIRTLAGTGAYDYSGDNGPASAATFKFQRSVATDADGDIFVADLGNDAIRKISLAGVITTFAGGNGLGYSGDGGAATAAQVSTPSGVAVDAAGDVFISHNAVVREVTPDGIIHTYAGNGTAGYSGDGGAATAAELRAPEGLAVDASGDLFIADVANHVVREVNAATGVISTVAGNGVSGTSGSGGAATSAELEGPSDIALDPAGNLFIIDSTANAGYEVSAATGILQQALGAANGVCGAQGVATDSVGDVYVGDVCGQTVYEVLTQPTLNVSASSLDFGGQNVGTSSASQTVTLTNPSGFPVVISAITGTNANDFAVTSACGASLAAGASCTITVTFTPAATGSLAGTLTMADNAGTGTQTVALSGTGTAPGIAFSPVHLTFPSAPVGVASAPQTIVVTNPGTGPLTISSISTLPFNSTVAVTDDCGSTLAAGAHCTLSVVHTVNSVGTGGGIVQVTDNASGSPQIIGVRGIGYDPSTQQASIATIAGPGLVPGHSYQASAVSLSDPQATAADAAGNLYVAQGQVVRPYTVFKITPAGTLTFYAGTGVAGYSGDGGPASQARLDINSAVTGMAVDAAGNLYIPDVGNCVVREVNAATGIISTVAGNGICAYAGDNGPALQAELNTPRAVAVDGAGDLYIADTANFTVREVMAGSGVIKTVAGTGANGVLNVAGVGTSGTATAVSIGLVNGVTLDAAGDVYIADATNGVIWKVTAQTGQIAINAGEPPTGAGACAAAANRLGDGCPATQATVPIAQYAGGLALDAAGNLYVATGNGVREVVAGTGIMQDFAGQDTVTTTAKINSALGDGGPAAQAIFMRATGVTVLSNGNVLITDGGEGRIRQVAGGVITTVAGNGFAGETGNGGAATQAQVSVDGLVVTPSGDLLATSNYDNLIRVITADGTIHAFAGNGSTGYSGDRGAATAASFSIPAFAAVDATGDKTIVADWGNNAVRAITSAGAITTIAGGNGAGYSGDGGAATAARLNSPGGVAIDATGDIFISDSLNNVVREVTPDGVIHTYGGTGAAGYSGDGGAAAAAALRGPAGLALDASGDLYVADSGNHVVREVNKQTGTISTVAGNGSSGMAGLEGPATAAQLTTPYYLALDSAGDLFISDIGYPALDEVVNGTIHYLTGRGTELDPNYAGPAAAAGLSSMQGVAVDAAGDVYLADLNGGTIREIKTRAGVALSASSLNLGNQNIASTSAPQTLTITNNGGAVLTVSNAALAGANASDFALTNNCTASLNVGSSCTITVTFSPAATGARTAALTVTDNSGAGSSQTVSLSGTGTQPQAVMSSSSLSFGSQAIGSTSAAQTITLSNSGTGPLSLQSIAASGAFAESNGCGATLAAGASCAIAVTFTPTAAGAASGTLTVNDNAANSSQTATLAGSGIAMGLSLSPSIVNFGSVPVGTAVAQGVTIVNTGSAALHVSGVTASGDFSASGNCATIPAASGCSVIVTFTPAATGARTGTLSISDDAAGSPQTVPLAGTGIAPGVAVAPASVAFPATAVAGASFPITVTVTNSGTAPLTGLALSTVGDFTQTSGCTTLAAGTSCSASVVFSPTVAGLDAGTLVVTDNAGTQTVALAGTGVAPGAVLSAAQLLFGGQRVETTSAAQTVVLSNTGASVLAITSITASSGFSEVTGCGASLAAGASCAINVSFQPSAAGAQTGAVTIVSAAGTQTITLSGLGTAAGLTIMPAAVSFGAEMIGTTSASQTLTVTNSGTTALTLAPVAASGDFSQVNACPPSPATLAAGASCLINVSFTPAVAGPSNGTVTVTDTGGLTATAAVLSGTGTLPGISAAPASLFFGGQPVGALSAAQTVTVTNSGTAPLQVAAVLVSGDFTQVNTCTTAAIAPSQSCIISVAMAPTTLGNETGTLQILDNADGLHAVALSGVGVGPGATVAPAALAFGSQPIPGANASGVTLTGASQTVVLANTGNTALTISGVTALGPFSQSSNCGMTLAAGSSCSITVSFTPTLLGQMTGVLIISDNSASGVQTVSLNGYGSPNGLTLTPPSFSFGSVPVGQTSPPQTATLTNNTGQSIASLTISASGEFAQTNTCGTTLASGASCQINVTLTPLVSGAITGSIAIAGALAGTRAALGAKVMDSRRLSATSTGGLAEIALGGSGDTSGVELSATALSFATQTVGTTSAAQTVTLTNRGASALSGIQVSANGAFAQTSTCGTSLAAGASCAIAVTFTPLVAGTRAGVLGIADSASGSPQTVSLTGTAVPPAPAVTFSASSLSFAAELTGNTSAAQNLKLTNSGTAALAITSVAASGDFAETNACGTSLAAGASCTIAVSFTPTVAGSRSGSLTLADSAASSPQTVVLAGTGADVAVSGGGASATVIAGGTASYALTFAGSSGFSGAFTLSCSGAPQGAVCTPRPGSISVAAGAAVPVTVTVQTVDVTALPPPAPSAPGGPMLAWLSLGALLLLAGGYALTRRRRSLALVLGLAALMSACGGINNLPQPGSTSAGSYVLTVTASGPSGQRSATLNLTVH